MCAYTLCRMTYGFYFDTSICGVWVYGGDGWVCGSYGDWRGRFMMGRMGRNTIYT